MDHLFAHVATAFFDPFLVILRLDVLCFPSTIQVEQQRWETASSKHRKVSLTVCQLIQYYSMNIYKLRKGRKQRAKREVAAS